MKNKKSFILYADLICTVSKLPDEIAGKLFKTILDYVNDKNPEPDDLILQIAFEPIKQQLKRDLRDWEDERQKRSESGRIGGINSGISRSKTKQNEAKRRSASKNEANEADNVTVTVTVNDTEIRKEIDANFENVKQYINQKLNKKFIANCKPSKELLKLFTFDEMKTAIDNATNDKFHIDTKFKYLTPKFFTRIDKVEKWLNISNETNKPNKCLIPDNFKFDKNLQLFVDPITKAVYNSDRQINRIPV